MTASALPAPSPAPSPAIARELALLALLATLWGASYTFIKLGVATIPPVTLIAARTLIAGLALLALLRLRGVALPSDGATWRAFAVQAVLNSALPFTLIAWAELRVDASLAAILNATTPVFAFLIALALPGRGDTGPRKLFGVAAGLAGIVLVIGPRALESAGGDLWAELAVVAATVAYGAAAVYGARFRGMDSMVPAAGSLLCGAALLVPLGLVLDRPWTLDPSATSLVALAALALLSTALAFVIYFRLFRTLGPVGATAQAYLRVPVGVAIGVLALGEAPAPTAWLGLVLIVGGVAAMTAPAPRTGDRP
ncbi:DMT family transporter [Azospirillum halopraeferens]|uniref:DMT family transporter n=1 Tax=Azospirillum halopraeferens TaxID=34010 RepID=UPI00042A01F6|nr:EamA family transporter [Azospirillum halopraeferens]